MKIKKIIALAGVAILILLYIITFISAIFTSAATPELFKACVLATFVIPVFLYGYLLVYKLMKDRAKAAKAELEEAINAGAGSDSDTEPEINDSDGDETNNTTP